VTVAVKLLPSQRLAGMEGDVITMTDIFVFEQTGHRKMAGSVGRHTSYWVAFQSSWIRSNWQEFICHLPSLVLANAVVIKLDSNLEKLKHDHYYYWRYRINHLVDHGVFVSSNSERALVEKTPF